MSATLEIHRLIEKLLVDTAFNAQLTAEPDPGKRRDIIVAAGFTVCFTNEELEAELNRLSSAALAVAHFEASISTATGVKATWLSQLATLSQNAHGCISISR
jgi:hypothetical protein